MNKTGFARTTVVSGSSSSVGDMYLSSGTGPNVAYSQTLKSPPMALPAGTVSSIPFYVILVGGAAGSATVKINRPWFAKRFAGWAN